MSCADYKKLGNYFHIMMPTKKNELGPMKHPPPPREMYTQIEPKSMEDAKMQNQTFSTQMKGDYIYSMEDKVSTDKK
jgi:hypothetical protein